MKRIHLVFSEMPPKARMEALVDGVFAVAFTIMVLDIKLPDGVRFSSNAELLQHFSDVINGFVVYVISFIALAMLWVAHHYQFRYVKKLDRRLLWINMMFLLLVTTVPFATNLVGTHGALSLAISIYALNLLLLALVLMLHNQSLLSKRELAVDEYSTATGTAIRRRLGLMCGVAVLAIAAAQISPRLGFACFLLLAVFHFVPQAITQDEKDEPPSPPNRHRDHA